MEDAAHSFGAAVDGRRIGGFGDATVFSFYATKCITTGDGGSGDHADEEMADKLQLLSFHGMDGNAWQRYGDKGRWYYEVVAMGYKLHLGDPAAALGLVQLGGRTNSWPAAPRWPSRFNEAFAGPAGWRLPAEADWATHAWHLYILRVDPRGGRRGPGRPDRRPDRQQDRQFGSFHSAAPPSGLPRRRRPSSRPCCPKPRSTTARPSACPCFPAMTDCRCRRRDRVVTGSVRRRTR